MIGGTLDLYQGRGNRMVKKREEFIYNKLCVQ